MPGEKKGFAVMISTGLITKTCSSFIDKPHVFIQKKIVVLFGNPNNCFLDEMITEWFSEMSEVHTNLNQIKLTFW